MFFIIKLWYVRGVYNVCWLELYVRIDWFFGLRLMVYMFIMKWLFNFDCWKVYNEFL